MASALPTTLGTLRSSEFTPTRVGRSVKDELRENLIARLRAQAASRRESTLFPGIVGYEDTVIPQIVNAVLSRHNFILLGLRGQAKSAHPARALTALLDRTNALASPAARSATILTHPLCKFAAATSLPKLGDATPNRIPHRATSATWKNSPRPDVTVADLVSATSTPSRRRAAGNDLGSASSLCTTACCPAPTAASLPSMKLPDLAGKIQVALFNIMQEGDVQIKGYPVRLPLDVAIVFSANPGGLHRARQNRDSAQGPHRLRNPHALSRRRWKKASAITAQESWSSACRIEQHAQELDPAVHPRGRRADCLHRARR
jgi:magnesium chelatase subunit I